MSNDLVLQADLSSLTVNGLSAFVPLLAALSADNVAPGAVIQLEKLGAMFPISGPYAARVPDLLQRCPSKRLDRVGVIIGWRKGDTASVVSQSAGGQAVALLCFCIRNLYNQDRCGAALYDLCEKMIPKQFSISSIDQIGQVTTLLFSKLLPLGFGNIHANQVRRIQETYQYLKLPMAGEEFFESMSREGLVDLLSALYSALCEDDCVVQISGFQAMGDVVALVSIMFPEDTTLIVEDFIIQEGIRRKIVVTLASKDPVTQLRVERQLRDTAPRWLPLGKEQDEKIVKPYTYVWEGHVADALQLAFLENDKILSQDLLDACANLALAIAPRIKRGGCVGTKGSHLPMKGFLGLLGQDPIYRLLQSCRILLRSTGSASAITNVDVAFSKLVSTFEKILGSTSCLCSGATKCDRTAGWESVYWSTKAKGTQRCVPRRLWRCIGNAIYHVLLCSLTNAEPNAAIQYDRTPSNLAVADPLTPYLKERVYDSSASWTSCDAINEHLFGLIGTHSRQILAASNNSSTIYPAALQKLRLDVDEGVCFDICDGVLIFRDKSYPKLISIGRPRGRSSLSRTNSRRPIVPSSVGEHSSLLLSVRETSQVLELRTSVVVRGQSKDLELAPILVASMAIEDADTCDHDEDAELDETSAENIVEADVAAPESSKSKIAIVQTQGNETAQMLACCPGTIPIIQRRCCLSCAVTQARREGRRQVIVGIR